MSKKTKGYLKEALEQELERMQNSKYECDKSYSEQMSTMFCYASGYAPDIKAGELYIMIKSILDQTI